MYLYNNIFLCICQIRFLKNIDREDEKQILKFFYTFWNEYKDTTPCLMFVPVKEVGINTENELEKYLNEIHCLKI